MQITPKIRKLSGLVTLNRFFTVFTCLSIFAVVLRYCFFDTRDPSKCGALMNEGVWLDRPPINVTGRVPTEWQPPNCMMHKYQPAEVASCFTSRRLVFAGDSTIRQIFWGFAEKLDKDIEPQGKKHADITVEKAGVTLEFLWDPYLNSSRVRKELALFEGAKYYGQDRSRPAIMLVGTGLWFSRFQTLNALKKWRDTIDDLVQFMRAGRKTTDMTRQDLLLLAPVVVPEFSKLNKERSQTISPQQIGEMNQYLQQLSDIQGFDVVWAFYAMRQGLPQAMGPSGIHTVHSIIAKQAEALINLRCNAMGVRTYPNDGTCCTMYEAPNYQQWFGLIFVLAVLPIMSYLRSKADTKGRKAPAWLPSDSRIHALLVFGLAVIYCFYADRTQVFNKIHKHYNVLQFSFLTLLWVTAGALTLRRTSITATDQPFLPRHQTEEWKGWLQFAILVYHYTGASKVAWIYSFIRITVAAYLFMTGYGHTVYFYKKGDYSLKRVASVLIRVNLLSCVLPYMMKTEYIFYYFAPLVSFWFLVVYVTMRVGFQKNSNPRFLISKIIVSAVLTTALIRVPGILETLFEIPRVLAGTQWDVPEFRFRVFLDMWIVYVGMVTALAAIKFSDTSDAYAAVFSQWRKYALTASAAALPLYILFQMTRESKFVYNAYHPYVSWIPILAFICLRNATPKLRNTHSAALAWLGTCSLETFTLQFHIWLAADTKGLLRLGLFENPTGDFVVATTVFLFVSHCVAGVTGELVGWIMGVPEKQAARLPTKQEARFKELKLVPQQTQQAKAEGLKGNLKVRCIAVIMALWLLNLVYTG